MIILMKYSTIIKAVGARTSKAVTFKLIATKLSEYVINPIRAKMIKIIEINLRDHFLKA